MVYGVCDARNDGKAQKKRTVQETVLREMTYFQADSGDEEAGSFLYLKEKNPCGCRGSEGGSGGCAITYSVGDDAACV